ncbi:MAG: hypothetical protein MI700_11045 [Balneolales bacterium]|nr:hypothetical protein [Balneolales bacterium]
MNKSVEHLLSESIDYASLKPPVSMALVDALREYVRITNSEDKWMLSRFVIPYNQVPELRKFADRRYRLKGPLNLCIFGPIVNSLHEFKNTILNIEKDILSAHSGFPGEVRTNVLELALPTISVESLNPEELVKAIEAVVTTSADSRLLPHRVYFEIPGQDIEVETAKKIIKVIAVHNKSVLKRKIDNYLFSGLKINCTPPPSTEFLAEVMLYARDANVAIKFAGHNIRSFSTYDYTSNERVFGFINIFMAGLLAYTQDLTVQETVEVLTENNPSNFIFKDAFIAWRELAAPMLEIKMLRMLSITSFNLTDFESPLHGLKERSIL